MPNSHGYRRRLARRLTEKQKRLCALCFKPLDPVRATLDHIIPASLGGPKSPWNLQATHPDCNNARGNRRIEGININASLFERRIVFQPPTS